MAGFGTGGARYSHSFSDSGGIQRLAQPRRHPSKFAPLNWANLRGDLDSMLEAREGVLLLGMYNSPDASEASAGLQLALRASSEYILELTHCLAERPQGKGGWQRAAKLDELREQVVAAIDAA